MQTLGLASEQKPTDGMVKRLFWPTIENYADLDLVSQQGFWVCFAVGMLTLIMSFVTGGVLVGVLVAVIFWLGGMGVRERSIAAAVLVFAYYALDKVAQLEFAVMGSRQGFGNPLLGYVAIALLLANVRATILARRWKGSEFAEEIGELPERMTSDLSDKMVNVLPARVWPVGRFVFFPLAGILLALTLLGMATMPFLRHKAVQPAPKSTQYPFPGESK